MHHSIRHVLLSHLYSSARSTFIATILGSSLIALQFRAYLPFSQLLMWWVLIVLVNFGRWMLARQFFKKPRTDERSIRLWNSFFIVGLLFSTTIWAYGAVRFFPSDSVFLQSILLLAFLGISAGGTTSLGSSLICVALHAPIVSSAVAWGFFKLWYQDSLSSAFACFFYVIIYNLVLLSTAYRYRRSLIRQTELQIANERLIKRLKDDRAQAVSENKAKSTFLATMSHEIRTPLNGLFGMMQILRSELTDKSHRADVETMYRSARSLLSILNDILDFSKISAGRMELDHVPFDWTEMVQEIAELMKGNAEAKGLAFELEMAPSQVRFLVGDALRLRQIMVNLLDNAIKFTESGKVTFSVSGVFRDANLFQLSIKVRDTGIGISEGAQKRIFSRFSQADSSTTRQFGGTGLGLAISQKLVELMGSRIDCTSRVGEGSVFSFDPVFGIDLDRVDQPQVVSEGATSGQSYAVPLIEEKVLVVDDDIVGRKVTSRLLGKLGYASEAFESGIDVLKAYREKQWDLIFLDMQMPGMDGIETAETIRRMESSGLVGQHRSHIIACTANLSNEDRNRCLQAGMNDYVGKPLLLEELRDALERYEELSVEPKRSIS